VRELRSIRFHLVRIDWSLFAAVVVLLVAGVLFVYSASYRGDDLPVAPFFKKQIVWAVLGLLGLVAFTLLDYHRLRAAAWWAYAAALVLLILVLLVGRRVYGATRWLSLFGVQIQPSEFAKLAVLLVLARYLSRPNRDLAGLGTLAAVGAILALPMLLVLREPDLGTAVLLLPLAFVMMFVAGVPLRWLIALVGLVLLLLPLAWWGMSDYQHERVLAFLDPGRDPLGAGWNKLQSAIAVGSGGLKGKGFLQGTQNVLGFLPRTVAPTDFIYSVIAEEMGFVGSLVLLMLFAIVLAGTGRAALAARDRFGRLLATGVMTLLFCHVFINLGMTVGLLPVTGLPLPLISYGGTFMLSTLVSLGMVQSVFVRRIRR